MGYPKHWTKRNPHSNVWAPAVTEGMTGVIKECGGDLSGLRVSYVGRLNGVPWVKMVDASPGYPTGQAFPYKLKWVAWEGT